MNKAIISISIFMLISVGCSTMKNKNPSDSSKRLPPSIRNAEVKTLWIPDKIEADRYEEGHYLYIIEKPSTWRAE